MGELTVGVRELKAHLSAYLRQVQNGQVVVITDHGKTVGRIVPEEQSLAERLRSLQEAGLFAWNGEKLPSLMSPVVNHSGKLVSDLVVEMREPEA